MEAFYWMDSEFCALKAWKQQQGADGFGLVAAGRKTTLENMMVWSQHCIPESNNSSICNCCSYICWNYMAAQLESKTSFILLFPKKKKKRFQGVMSSHLRHSSLLHMCYIVTLYRCECSAVRCKNINWMQHWKRPNLQLSVEWNKLYTKNLWMAEVCACTTEPWLWVWQRLNVSTTLQTCFE